MWIDIGEMIAGKQDDPSVIIEVSMAKNAHLLHFDPYMENWWLFFPLSKIEDRDICLPFDEVLL